MRDRWSSKLIFILAAVGSAIGLGNVWRFPYLVGKYGGGAFMVPYLIVLVVMGIPLLMMEFALGQKMQQGAVGAFKKIHKQLGGVGLAAVLCGFVVTCYYMLVMAWSVLYAFFSLNLSWGSDTKSFFFNDVLNISSGVQEYGHISTAILIALVVSWIMVYFSVWKGVHSVGKVVTVTMPLPVIILIIIGIRGVTLPGAMDGLAFYLTPNFKALLDFEVWAAAMSQIFFTLTLGFGVMIAYSSFRESTADITKSAIITALINSGISIVAGFAVFSTLGYMARQSGIPIAELAKSGPSLAFIVFPQALSLIPGAKVFALLFFIMLITLAVDSAFSLVEAVATVVHDKFSHVRKQDLILYICVVGFIGGIIFSTYAGLYYLDIVDHFITSYGLVMVGLVQAIVVGWVYGAENLRSYMNSVSDIQIGKWWNTAIKYVIPALLILIIGTSLVQDLSKPYEGYPSWALSIFGWGTVGLVATISFFYSIKGKKQKQTTP